jgi:RimJ/RimL family protein N-acetyltransferase
MLTFERSRDFAIIGEIMRHAKLYDACADDFSPTRERFVPREEEAIWYVLARNGERVLGLFALAPQNAICWEIHTRLLPESWGAAASAAARGVVLWIFANTPCVRLVTACPAYNRLAIRFAERAGMTCYGINLASWQKNGKLFNQVLLGISKYEPFSPTNVGRST